MLKFLAARFDSRGVITEHSTYDAPEQAVERVLRENRIVVRYGIEPEWHAILFDDDQKLAWDLIPRSEPLRVDITAELRALLATAR